MKDSFKIFAATLIIVLERAVPIFKAVLFPAIILTALSMIEDFVGRGEIDRSSLTYLLAIVFMLLNIALYAYIAISVHRIVLLGTTSVPTWGIKGWTKREQTFFFCSFSLAVLNMIFMVISSITEHWIGLLIALILGLVVSARLSLVLPACAVDQNISFRESFDLTKNKTLFMVMAMYIWPILSLVPIFIVMWIIGLLGGGVGAAISQIIYDIFTTLLVIITIASLSLAYLFIIGKDENLK